MNETKTQPPLRPDRKLESGSDANLLFEAAFGEQTSTILLLESDLGPAFYDLRTGLAGDLLQRFVNFRIPLAVVVEQPPSHGDRFGELVHEHRTHPVVRFFTSELEARTWLEKKQRELA